MVRAQVARDRIINRTGITLRVVRNTRKLRYGGGRVPNVPTEGPPQQELLRAIVKTRFFCGGGLEVVTCFREG